MSVVTFNRAMDVFLMLFGLFLALGNRRVATDTIAQQGALFRLLGLTYPTGPRSVLFIRSMYVFVGLVFFGAGLAAILGLIEWRK